VLWAVAAAVLMSGCSTIMEGGTQPLSIRSVPETTTISVTNRAGDKIHVGTTPTTLTLKRGAGYFKAESYTIHFEKEGYQARDVVVTASVNGWYWANLLFGGILGMLIVDPVSGAMYSLAPEVTSTLSELTVSKNGDLTIALVSDVPASLLAKATPISF
jgi:hypothetical protein